LITDGAELTNTYCCNSKN